jgi:ATP-dependent Clp protease adaptor protein ClpS
MSQKKSKKRGKFQVMLNNDNVNTFDHVITCLIDICGHSYFQALQCATLTHGAHRCSVYVDNHKACENIRIELIREGLNATVEKYIEYV